MKLALCCRKLLTSLLFLRSSKELAFFSLLSLLPSFLCDAYFYVSGYLKEKEKNNSKIKSLSRHAPVALISKSHSFCSICSCGKCSVLAEEAVYFSKNHLQRGKSLFHEMEGAFCKLLRSFLWHCCSWDVEFLMIWWENQREGLSRLREVWS